MNLKKNNRIKTGHLISSAAPTHVPHRSNPIGEPPRDSFSTPDHRVDESRRIKVNKRARQEMRRKKKKPLNRQRGCGGESEVWWRSIAGGEERARGGKSVSSRDKQPLVEWWWWGGGAGGEGRRGSVGSLSCRMRPRCCHLKRNCLGCVQANASRSCFPHCGFSFRLSPS